MGFEEFRVRVHPLWSALGLFDALIGFWLLAKLYYAVGGLLGLTGPWTALIYTGAQATGFAVLLYVLRREGNTLSSVWLGGRGPRELAYALAFLAAAWVLWGLLSALGAALGLPEYRWWSRWGVRGPLDVLPVGAMAVAAAFFEETFYRGYAITRLYTFTGSMALAAAVSIAFFTLIHLFFGPRVMLCILGWAVLDTLLFIYRRSTWASFYYHVVNNAIVYIVFPLAGLWR